LYNLDIIFLRLCWNWMDNLETKKWR